MKLYYTKVSPFARKVRILAYEKGLHDRIDLIEVNLMEKPDELLALNPLGGVPLLVTDNAEVVYDSSVICEYLDGLSDTNKMIPDGDNRIHKLTVAALADGLVENCVAIVYERRKPEDKQLERIITKNFDDIKRILTALDTDVNDLEDVSIASVAVAAALGYMSFRLPDFDWKKSSPKLAKWYKQFSARDSMKMTEPS